MGIGRDRGLWRIGAGVLAAALLGCGSSQRPQIQAGACTLHSSGGFVSAHRGGAAYAPENTLLAFANAVRLGVDEIELDVQLTADGELVVIHDDTLDRTTDCSGTVGAWTLAQIRACDAAYWFAPGQATTAPDTGLAHPLRGTGVRIPSLREVLDWHATLPCPPRLSIEIKNIPGETNFDPVGTRSADVLLPLLEAYALAERIVVQSFWPPTLDAVKRRNPAIRTQLLTTSSTGQTATMNLAYTTAGGHDISAPNFDAPDFDAAFVALAHAAGKAVVPYTVDTARDQQTTLALGVDGLITNYPGCALHLRQRPLPDKLTPDGVPPLPACPPSPGNPLPGMPDRPSPEVCAALRPARWQPASGAAAPHARLRVVGIQFKHDVRHVESYASFRTKMRCLMEDHAVPLMQPGLPMLVVFNEDIGLMTLATGSRGALVREQAQTPLRAPAGDAAPLGIVAALGLLNTSYAPQIAAYQAMFGPVDPRKQVLLAATDTFARAYSQTFSDIARDYGVYVVASNNMARYRASRDPLDIALFKDPDLDSVDEVYIATEPVVTNQTAIWGPVDIHPEAPKGETNLLFRNHKVPLTDIELTVLALDEGPAEGDAALANAAGIEIEGFRLGFATSLPAFQWGYDFGQRPADFQPCADVRARYMPCMDALGVDVVIQAEANPGRWATNQAGGWQPLEWMLSTWRTVADPTVRFRYNVTPHLVGNLLDLVFDGQSAITARGAQAPLRHYVGNLEFEPGVDLEAYRVFQGEKREFIALAPWVVPDAPRAELRAVAAALAPGSGDALENDYLETAVWADFTR
ncbi:Glycerophosphoryl diester phosphodiesterase [Fontimonas thermophila]|uniref:Glycerophosphoryl diester phosphodiesterase n=1 Tax=Fontimonas thermophila TaxID=1076937 RepID=A0A1I2K9D1_9GAMM|nr:glycerophosphodiester phosphodiesterase family protein [Fontimonas thermophila]SFF61847.1 Glycerophosphoryl diester phosphodiesterase [Fontimonas thermophila]